VGSRSCEDADARIGESTNPMATMKRLGWWSTGKNDIISTLLSNLCLSRIVPVKTELIQLTAVADPQHIVELIIVAGLSKMVIQNK